MKLDTDKFLFIYQQEEFSTLNDHQRGGLLDLISFIETDTRITDPRWAAYMLATVKHETAGTFLPIEEYGKGKKLPYGNPDPVTGESYYGRGYVQLTWAANYKELGRDLRLELYEKPELALEPGVAFQIMSFGMRTGAFTGVNLRKYINDDGCDYRNARRIINGVDCADKIAGYAEKFERVLNECQVPEIDALS